MQPASTTALLEHDQVGGGRSRLLVHTSGSPYKICALFCVAAVPCKMHP